MTKPTNLRKAECYGNCKHYTRFDCSDGGCTLHKQPVYLYVICDDFLFLRPKDDSDENETSIND